MRLCSGLPGTTIGLLLLLSAGCGAGGGGEQDEVASTQRAGVPSAEPQDLARQFARIDLAAARIDSIFQPLPLMRPAQEEALRRFSNQAQLRRARALGIDRLLSESELLAHREAGRLILLEDSEQWIVREMDHSQPLAVPATSALLTEIGERFQSELAEMGAPPFRLEVSSVLRTAADQEALRRVNPNAALGESTHEYGTTVDVLYSAFASPATPIVEIEAENVELRQVLERYASVAAERVAARRALELKAILAGVLRQMQDEGKVMVTLERLQPVFHMTVAEDL